MHKEVVITMPKIESKLQDFIFGVLMVAIMVIFMVTYNIALQHGGVNVEVLSIVAQAIWAPMIIAFIVENLFVGKVAKRIAFKVVDPRKSQPIFVTLAI